MLSPKALGILGFSIKYASFLKMIPYNWDHRAWKLYRLTDQAYFSWKITKSIFYLFEIFTIVRIAQDFLDESKTLDWTFFILQLIFAASMTVPCLITIVISRRSEEIMDIINLYVQFFVKIYGKFKSLLLGSS